MINRSTQLLAVLAAGALLPATSMAYPSSKAGQLLSTDGWSAPSGVRYADPCSEEDLDEDGFSDCDGDCDDADPNAFPGNPEVCDGVDNDCNEEIDDGLTSYDYYTDGDGDGYGAGEVADSGCDSAAPSGYSDTSDDCDDMEASTNPGAAEVCDGVDNDCSGVEDDGLESYDYYTDGDGDGYGAGDVVDSGCDSDAPSGYSDTADDCDDAEAATNPGADETWYDGVDSDCDGGSDYDADGDGFDSDEYDGADCDDSDADINPDAEDAPDDGVDADCDGIDPIDESDKDGDGFEVDEDCDDENAQVNPEAEEIAGDGIDNDCDPETTDEYEPIGEVDEFDEKKAEGCATASAPLALGAWAGLMSVLGLARRRND